MKVTFLSELVKSKSREVVETGGSYRRYRIVEQYWRSPTADELIGIDSEIFDAYARAVGEPFPFSLKSIGGHPGDWFTMICSRSDGGSFWRGVAVAKYWTLVAEYWVKTQVFWQLHEAGMMVVPLLGERWGWRYVRLDWLLITLAIASAGLIGLSFLWLYDGGYVQSILSLLLSLSGWLIAGGRRTVLLEMRDRQMREVKLRAFFQSRGIELNPVDFEECLAWSMQPEEVFAVHQARQRVEQLIKRNLSNTCIYYHSSVALPCAVHPSNQSMGLCNENCPDFTPKQMDEK